jgi:hypothetical protein
VVGRGVALLALLAAATGCSAEPAAPAPELTAEARQYRADVAHRRLAVALTNEGAEPVTVLSVQLAAPGFEPQAATERVVELAPGARVDLRTQYGAARCDGPPPGPPDLARVTVRAPDGSQDELRVVLPPGTGLLERIRTKDCAQRELRAAVDLQLGPTWTRSGERLVGELVVLRGSGDAPVTVTEPAGHIVFTVRPAVAASPLVALAPGQRRAEVALTLTPTRCDGHALASNSRASIFGFYISVGGAEPLQTPVTADPALQAQLARLAAEVCQPGA